LDRKTVRKVIAGGLEPPVYGPRPHRGRHLCHGSNLDAHRAYSAHVDRTAGLICDQTIALDEYLTRRDYPEHLWRIRVRDAETGKTLVFLTNQVTLPALTICALYKSRWQVELFFKWIKQHLRIKQCYGTSENAVKTQIWIAVSVYVLVAIVRRRLRLEASLYTLLQVLSITVFEKMPIQSAFSATPDGSVAAIDDNQLNCSHFNRTVVDPAYEVVQHRNAKNGLSAAKPHRADATSLYLR
jgi:hypothetical protein